MNTAHGRNRWVMPLYAGVVVAIAVSIGLGLWILP
ncbi:hypothetical protein BGCPKDLD_1795 [Methylorubrum suomiense]|uniref:Uncharacterized protein n=2 Tax=Methylorubrum suomiense TaxID=144191 RepID=A0ABQ4USX0_9HYPH|nr:hypothetical protein BGCPKDLD_1795 [Methylorubrum suomiense]